MNNCADELFHEMVGRSAAFAEVRAFVETVSRGNSTVLILGESGTGKELVASAIHRASARCAGPYVALNCTALPDELVESELFGHEKGAFTGASARSIGNVECAGGGTLFLDEVGDMKLSTQVKLLRFLETRSFQRLGSRTPIRMDVRIIAATNRDLEAAVAGGEFRTDLYYRLKVLTITLPPLRDRREDILPLAMHFVSKYAKEHGRETSGISPEAATILTRHDWPGNVRELAHVIEAAVVRGSGALVLAKHLPKDVVLHPPRSRFSGLTSLEKVRREAERFAAENALMRANGDFKEAARLLEIHYRSFYRLLGKIGG